MFCQLFQLAYATSGASGNQTRHGFLAKDSCAQRQPRTSRLLSRGREHTTPWITARGKSALLELNQCPSVYQTDACTNVSYARIHSTSVVNKRYVQVRLVGFEPTSSGPQPDAPTIWAASLVCPRWDSNPHHLFVLSEATLPICPLGRSTTRRS